MTVAAAIVPSSDGDHERGAGRMRAASDPADAPVMPGQAWSTAVLTALLAAITLWLAWFGAYLVATLLVATALGAAAIAWRFGASPGAAAERGALASLLSVLFWLELIVGVGSRSAAMAVWPVLAIAPALVWRRRRVASPAAAKDAGR